MLDPAFSALAVNFFWGDEARAAARKPLCRASESDAPRMFANDACARIDNMHRTRRGKLLTNHDRHFALCLWARSACAAIRGRTNRAARDVARHFVRATRFTFDVIDFEDEKLSNGVAIRVAG